MKAFIKECVVPDFLLPLVIGNAATFELITKDVVEKEIITETDLIKTADNFLWSPSAPKRPEECAGRFERELKRRIT